jgi:hypothetical protein
MRLCQEAHLVSEQEALEILAGFANALEAAAVNVKRQIAELQEKSQKEPIWNPEEIKWEPAEGSKGPFERSEDINSADFKVMLKDIQQHKGKLSRGGYYYWAFTGGAIVGRKKLAQTV